MGAISKSLAVFQPVPAALEKGARVLVVDDEPGIRDLLSYELGAAGYKVETAADGAHALEQLTRQDFQIVLCDMKMPRLGGLQVLAAVRQKTPAPEIIMMTGYGTIETAVLAMKQGAYDFIQKPFNLNEVLMLIEKCLEKSNLRATAALYEASQPIFRSIKIHELLPLIIDLAQTIFQPDDLTLLLTDDNGGLQLAASTGKFRDAEHQSRMALATKAEKKIAANKPLLLETPFPPDWVEDVLCCPGVTSVLLCPFSIDHERLGILSLHRSRVATPFNASDLAQASIFVSQIAQAVFNARLYRRLDANVQQLREANQKIKETQTQLIQAEKMAGIGQLAAGVAHELNNPLSGIMGFTQLLLSESTNLTPQQRNDLDTVYVQSKRCQAIIRNLLEFSRASGDDQRPVDLGILLQKTLELVKHDFSISHTQMTTHIPPVLSPVYGNEGQLQQIFLNLLTNARHAVANTPDATITIAVEESDHTISVRFVDNGAGIPPEIQGKIFEPFFTTKPIGQGTGLGLSICYGIVQRHHGTLQVQSAVGVGSEFTLELPVYDAAKQPVIQSKE